MNETINIINKRTSLRNFCAKPIEPELEDIILNSAMRAPTAGNMMLYTVLNIKKQSAKDILAETRDNQPFIKDAPLVLVFLADFQRWYDMFNIIDAKSLAKENNINWSGATIADFLLCCSDAMIAAQNTVIAAQSLGIGSCYIGDIMEHYEIHRDLFKLPDLAFPIGMVVFGYPASDTLQNPRARFDRKYIVHNETYSKFDDSSLLEMIKQRNPLVDPKKYIKKFFERKNGAEFSVEMERSAAKALEIFLGSK